MSRADREKWDRRWLKRDAHSGLGADPFLVEVLPRLRRGRALDLGAGEGRNALLLAGSGFRVDALDISPVALDRAARAARERGLPVRCAVVDLEAWLPPAGTYDLVVGVDFYQRPLLLAAREAVRPGGAVLAAQYAPGTHGAHEVSPAYRFELEDLRALLSGFDVRVAREQGGRREFLAVRVR
ncbi:MAG TPA: methyltransferase domain-containing protein [Planctomycetota bacterium]|jgi:SAM-dependent methyltransferase|nr:methyltransferase domain-containing protein [Planctomycetota bacterium]